MRLNTPTFENIPTLPHSVEEIKLALDQKEIPICRSTASPLSKLEKKPQNPQKEFIKKYSEYAICTQRMTGIPASVTLAQAALESGWGRHAPGNNFFGIKGKGSAGSQLFSVKEFKNGEAIRVRQSFRKYHSPLESFFDHARVISKGRYLKHAMLHTQSAQEFITALQSGKAKYATDPHYSEKLISIINKYGLEKYDY